MPSCLMLAARPSMALRSIFRRGFAAGGSKTDNDTDCNIWVSPNVLMDARSRDLAAPLPSFLFLDRRVRMHPMPPGEGGGSKRKEAPNEGPFRETLGCLARARGGAPEEAQNKQTGEPQAHALDARNGSSPGWA